MLMGVMIVASWHANIKQNSFNLLQAPRHLLRGFQAPGNQSQSRMSCIHGYQGARKLDDLAYCERLTACALAVAARYPCNTSSILRILKRVLEQVKKH